jgi:hypothetical protein
VRDVAGADSPQYQLMADSLAKQILQCSINYYNNAPYEDVESPKKAMVLQKYALDIAVGKLTKDRCQENCQTLQEAIDEMPPIEVAVEVNKVREELRKFCKLPDLICHSVTLLNATQPLLQTIKYKLGSSHPFYLKLSTQIVGNALHNVIEEVNNVQKQSSQTSRSPYDTYGLFRDDRLEALERLSKVMATLRKAWDVTLIMDTFDLEPEYRTKRYIPNRNTLKEMCDSLKISTRNSDSFARRATQSTSTTNSSSSSNTGCMVFLPIVLVVFLLVFVFSNILRYT